MRDTQLILIEGLPGSGKSTTAQWLCHVLEAMGAGAEWWHEQDAAHPVYRYDALQDATRSGHAVCLAHHAAARRRWQAFAEERTRAAGLSILESSFLQSPVTSIQMCGGSVDEMRRHIADTVSMLAPLKPLLILLGQQDVEAVYRGLKRHRGPEFEVFLFDVLRTMPFGAAYAADARAGVIELLRAYAGAVDDLVGDVPFDTVRVDVSGGRWDDYRATILAALGVPPVNPYAAVREIARFRGRYRDLQSNQELVVDTDDGGLFLQPMGTRLLPRRDACFEIEGLSVELTFEQPDAGSARILCASRLANLAPVWVRQL
jgi:hypothetical protein